MRPKVRNPCSRGYTHAMADPLHADADNVPAVGRRQLVLVDGRTFAISDESGEMTAPTHGLVHDDRRHLSRFTISVDAADIEILASSSPTPLSAVVVGSLTQRSGSSSRAVLTRRRWVAGGLREDIRVHNTSPLPSTATSVMCLPPAMMRCAMAEHSAHQPCG